MKNVYVLIFVLSSYWFSNKGIANPSEYEVLFNMEDQRQVQVHDEDSEFDITPSFQRKNRFYHFLSEHRGKIIAGAIVAVALIGGCYYYFNYHTSNASLTTETTLQNESVDNSLLGAGTSTSEPRPEPINEPEPVNPILDRCRVQLTMIEYPSEVTSNDQDIEQQNREYYYAAAFDGLRTAIKDYAGRNLRRLEEFNSLNTRYNDAAEGIRGLEDAHKREQDRLDRFPDNPRMQRGVQTATANLQVARREAVALQAQLDDARTTLTNLGNIEGQALQRLREIGADGQARGYDMNIQIPDPVFTINSNQ